MDFKIPDVEMVDDSTNFSTIRLKNNLYEAGLLPQRKYLSNRTGQFLTKKQEEVSNRLKRKNLESKEEEEQLNNIKKLRVYS